MPFIRIAGTVSQQTARAALDAPYQGNTGLKGPEPAGRNVSFYLGIAPPACCHIGGVWGVSVHGFDGLLCGCV